MKAIASKKIWVILLLIGGIATLLITRMLPDITARASSPDAIRQHQKEVTNRCLQISGLEKPQPVGSIVTFGDDIGYDVLMVRGHYPQPHMNNQIGKSLCLFNRATRQAQGSDASQPSRYNSDRTGFQFDYSTDFVAEVKVPAGEGEGGGAIERIDLWTQRDYEGIQAIEEPTELPPNISVAVEQNSKQLDLREWVNQSNQFTSPQHFTSLTIAGQRAISFQSTGLYDYENLVLATPVSSEVIVIRLGKDGLPEHEGVYRPVFQQVLSSLRFI
jgi:hypothetical protein